ncbi:MAG: shikimate kinase [Gemmatimonadaceae bacterium]|nr:shikimate kinase [Gemmatimonadaceae bacterium]
MGLPGSGKSTVGRRVARRLGRPFLDFDSEIERREGKSIAQLFSESGETGFRALELALTVELSKSNGMILAPGGGWTTIPGATALLRPPARMIYLRVKAEVAIGRILRGRRIRPLLQTADPLETLRKLLAEREAGYLEADHVIDVEVVKSQHLIATIARLALT